MLGNSMSTTDRSGCACTAVVPVWAACGGAEDLAASTACASLARCRSSGFSMQPSSVRPAVAMSCFNAFTAIVEMSASARQT